MPGLESKPWTSKVSSYEKIWFSLIFQGICLELLDTSSSDRR